MTLSVAFDQSVHESVILVSRCNFNTLYKISTLHGYKVTFSDRWITMSKAKVIVTRLNFLCKQVVCMLLQILIIGLQPSYDIFGHI